MSFIGLGGVLSAVRTNFSKRRCASSSLWSVSLAFPVMSRPPYPPVGRCIYCDAERYAPDSARGLAEEHIIPYGLNGDLVLPEASCRRCERITGRNDSLMLKGEIGRAHV